jgi:hypothetical protein
MVALRKRDNPALVFRSAKQPEYRMRFAAIPSRIAGLCGVLCAEGA